MSPKDLKLLCRSCLGKRGSVNLFATKHENSFLSELYGSICSLELMESDGLPAKLCNGCVDFLKQVYIFKKRARESENLLQGLLAKKQESVSSSRIKIKCESGFDHSGNHEFPHGKNSQESVTIQGNPCASVEELVISHKKCESVFDPSGNHEFPHGKSSQESVTIQGNPCASVEELVISHKCENVLSSAKYDHIDECDTSEDGASTSNKQISNTQNPTKKRSSRKIPADLTCTFCSIKFDSYNSYKLHRKKEADLRRKKKPCSVCHKFISTYKLKDHVNSHTKDRPYECEICKEKFRFRTSLTRHKFRHDEKKPHVCHICGKGFIQAPTLTDHIRTHSGEKSFICNICGKFFVTKHALGNHINMHKLKDNQAGLDCTDLTCKECEKTFTSKTTLKQHMHVHSKKEFLCSACGKKFSTKVLLDSHIKVHSSIKPYLCQICDKGFSQKNSLQKHNLTHTGEKPVLCIICGKSFSQKGHLTYHMRRHSGERPYSCMYCDKTFNHTGSLKVHVRLHTGEKPFVCDICFKGFYDSSNMKKHRKTHVT